MWEVKEEDFKEKERRENGAVTLSRMASSGREKLITLQRELLEDSI